MHEWQVFFQGEQWKKYEIKLESLKIIDNEERSFKDNNEERSFSWGRQRSLQEAALPLIHDRGLFFTKRGSLTLPNTRERQFSLQEAALPLIHDRGLLLTKRGSMTLPDTVQCDPPASSSMQQPRQSMIYGKPVALNELDGFRNGHTALMRAVFNGDPFDVELLLSVGCSVDMQDEAGRTGLMCSIILVRHQKNWRMYHTNSFSIKTARFTTEM
jgi:hypothetical protein